MLVVQVLILGMKTSEEDTYISDESWNFCEVSSFIPTDPDQSFNSCRKKKDFTDLGYTDSVINRIVMDARKESDDHSSTPAGKMSMLGARLRTPRREYRTNWMIASFMQDGMLATNLAKEPKYLPPQMGGTGVTALFDNPNNVLTYVHSYKNGTYQRIYATATAELRNAMLLLEADRYSAPILCSRLRDKQEYFWGTYDEKVFVPVQAELEKPALFEKHDGTNAYRAFEGRLERTRLIISRRTAEVELTRGARLTNLVSGVYDSSSVPNALEKSEKLARRAKFSGALNANAALQNLLLRQASPDDVKSLVGDSNFQMITSGRTEFTREDALWIYSNGRTMNFSLDDIYFPSDMFVRSEVSMEETLKVPNIPLQPEGAGGKAVKTTAKVGLYQINHSQEEWADRLLGKLVAERETLGRPLRVAEYGPIMIQDREWVNDDSGLISQCMTSTAHLVGGTVCLISADRRLANQMASSANVVVRRVHPLQYIAYKVAEGRRTFDSSEMPGQAFADLVGVNPWLVFVDTGSISAFASQSTVENRKVRKRQTLHTGVNPSGFRYTTTCLSEWKTRIEKEIHHPASKRKVWRGGSRPEGSAYSSHSSWVRSSRRSDTPSWRTAQEQSGISPGSSSQQ
nr:hypothetical protein [Leptosphaeria biglobosa narnavirus 13]